MPKRFAKINILFTGADRKLLEPILEQLRANGLKVSEVNKNINKKGITLAALSKSFYDDKETSDALLNLIGMGAENVLPIRLDDTPVPDTLKNALYSRNIIPATGRNAQLIAERIIAALPVKKPVLPGILIAGSLVIAALAGFLIWKAGRTTEEPVIPTETQAGIVIPDTLAGLTSEDLSMINSVTIVGDTFLYSSYGETQVNRYTDSYNTFDDDGAHWYSKTDGHEYQMTHYDDLHFLSLMPSLKYLDLVLVDCDASALPDLSGMLNSGDVKISDCNITDLGWLRGSKIWGFSCFRSSVTDFSALNGCEELIDVEIEFYGPTGADLGSFAPPDLRKLRIRGGEFDSPVILTALKDYKDLQELEISGTPVADISFLEGSDSLLYLSIEYDDALTDISAVGSLKKLKELYIGYSPNVTDFAPVAGCTALEKFRVQCDYNQDAIQDASFLEDLPKLRNIELQACHLKDMEFLKGISENQEEITLEFSGDILDYSGLQYISKYSYLHINPHSENGSYGDFSTILPFIQNAKINRLELHSCGNIDLSSLPDDISELQITDCDLTDLTGIKPYYSLQRLVFIDCRYLTSLNGLEGLPTAFGNGKKLNLEINSCQRLTDYSALEGAYLSYFKLSNVYSFPDMSSLGKVNHLCIEYIDGLNDLSFLEGINNGNGIDQLSLIALYDLYDLSPLKNIKVNHLEVPNHLAVQAEELVNEGFFKDYKIIESDGDWEANNQPVTLLNLGEIETLPDALLQRVERLCIVGDTLIDLERGDIWETWDNEANKPILLYHDYETDEAVQFEFGEGTITDLSKLSKLTNLRTLCLYYQPLENLNGIQNFSELEEFSALYCSSLTDASAVFACQQMQYLRLHGSPVESIQGVQNLQNLVELDIGSTKVSDISPLKAFNFSYATEQDGFRLSVSGTPIEDYSPLSSIPVLDYLDINNVDETRFILYLKNVEIHRISTCDSFKGRNDENSNEQFAEFIRNHPELRELQISWNNAITDLTPVLNLKNLERLRVSYDMDAAISSLDGKDYGFELEIEGQE